MNLCSLIAMSAASLMPLAKRDSTVWATPLERSPATTTTCDAAQASSAAATCFLSGCQALFDKVFQCFSTWTPQNSSSLFAEPTMELTHCCLCEDFLFAVTRNWDNCHACIAANVSNGADAASFGNVIGAQSAFCNKPVSTNLQTFITQWNAIPPIWSPFAYSNSIPFVTTNCQNQEQAFLSYYTTDSGNVFSSEPLASTSGFIPATAILTASVAASTGILTDPAAASVPMLTNTAPFPSTTPSATVGPNNPPAPIHTNGSLTVPKIPAPSSSKIGTAWMGSAATVNRRGMSRRAIFSFALISILVTLGP